MKDVNNLTEGSIFKTLMKFAIPFLIANFIQILYGAVDMAVVGWFSNAAGISAVSTGSQVMFIISSLISGLTMGGTILIGQYCGAKRNKDSIETISTMLALFSIAAIIFTVSMVFLVEPILKAMKMPQEAFVPAKQYVFICSIGIIFIFGYNAISAILRGIGDSKRPLIFVTIACCTNVILDLVFVGVLKFGAAGAAVATVLSQAVSMIISVIYLKRSKFIFDFKLSNFRIHKDKAKQLIKIALPVSLQESMVSLSFLFITAIINDIGLVASAAVGIAGKISNFAMLPAGAFSGAISAITAQNIGANKPERAQKSLKICIGISFVFSLVFFIWMQVLPESAMHIFKADPEVTVAGAQYLKSFSFDFMLVAFGFSLNGFFNGCGKTTFAMINGILASVLIRVPLSYILAKYVPSSLLGIGFAAPVATLTSVTIGLIYLKMDRWKNISNIENKPMTIEN